MDEERDHPWGSRWTRRGGPIPGGCCSLDLGFMDRSRTGQGDFSSHLETLTQVCFVSPYVFRDQLLMEQSGDRVADSSLVPKLHFLQL